MSSRIQKQPSGIRNLLKGALLLEATQTVILFHIWTWVLSPSNDSNGIFHYRIVSGLHHVARVYSLFRTHCTDCVAINHSSATMWDLCVLFISTTSGSEAVYVVIFKGHQKITLEFVKPLVHKLVLHVS